MSRSASQSSSTSSSSSSDAETEFGSRVQVDIGEQHVTASLCMHCNRMGKTKLLFVDIPKFQQCVVSSFRCKHCGFKGRDVQQAADIQDRGVEVTLVIQAEEDLSRGVIKSSTASLALRELGIEQEPRPMSGLYTTVEGALQQIVTNLLALQPERRLKAPEAADKIDDVILKINNVLQLKTQCTLVLRDPSGNSYIEPLVGRQTGDLDRNLTVRHFQRTKEEAQLLGISPEQEQVIQRQAAGSGVSRVDERKLEDVTLLLDTAPEDMPVMALPTKCPACSEEILNKSLLISIPYFKECLLMCSACDNCGFKSIEVKSAGAIPPHGARTTFTCTAIEDGDSGDLSRDVLKSDSCSLEIPELGLRLEPGTLGGVYTTLEGLLRIMYDELKRHSVFWLGDGSSSAEQRERWSSLLVGLQEMADGKRGFTIIIDDPLDASFIKNVYAPDDDPALKVEHYQRTAEQDDEYGLTGMDTERFEK